VDRIIKWGYFIIYIEEILVEDIARIYIKEDYIRLRPKICSNILGNILYKIKNLSSNINSILPINR